MLVAASIFGLLLTLGMKSFHESTQAWRKVNSASEASVNLRRATSYLQRDLFATSSRQIRKLQGPSSLTGFDGDAFWFLSATDGQGNFVRRADGRPFWQRNVLYYTVTPNTSEIASFGSGGADAAGYEDHCPHKVLVRKEIDWDGVTDIADESTLESLMSEADVASFLTRPSDLNLAGMQNEAAVQDVRLVAKGLLSTRCYLAPGSVRVRVLASANERAQKEAGFGASSLSGKPFIHEVDFTVVPRVDGG